MKRLLIRSKRRRLAINLSLCFAACLILKTLVSNKKNLRHEQLQTPVFILNKEEYPKIAWLLNYGTDVYTLNLVSSASKRAVATNYASQVTKEGTASLPVYPFCDDGPFWNHSLPLPESYILTNTHCCNTKDCSGTTPSSVTEFRHACASGHGFIAKDKFGKKIKQTNVNYQHKVHKAVHLVKDPYDTILDQFYNSQRDSTNQLNKEEFQKWCRQLDKKNVRRNGGFDVFDDKDFKEVPCHSELYKYVKWHELALQTIELLELPVLTVHFEDFEKDLDGTVHALLDFLQLQKESEPIELLPSLKGSRYFTATQQDGVRKLIERTASKETWKLMERYLL